MTAPVAGVATLTCGGAWSHHTCGRVTTAFVAGVATLCYGGAWSRHTGGRVTAALVAGKQRFVVVEHGLTTRAVE